MFTRKKEENATPTTVGTASTTSTANPTKKLHEETPAGPSGATGKNLSPDGVGAKPFARLGGRPPLAASASVLNSHLSFDGELKYAGSVTVDCEFRGSIVTDDTLIVGPSARVEAEIKAGVVEIAGKVRGNVQAKTRVKIRTGAEVYGNIETPTVSMEDGVVFEGHCTRLQGAHQTTGAAPAASSAVQQVLEGAAAPKPPAGPQPVLESVGSSASGA